MLGWISKSSLKQYKHENDFVTLKSDFALKQNLFNDLKTWSHCFISNVFGLVKLPKQIRHMAKTLKAVFKGLLNSSKTISWLS